MKSIFKGKIVKTIKRFHKWDKKLYEKSLVYSCKSAKFGADHDDFEWFDKLHKSYYPKLEIKTEVIDTPIILETEFSTEFKKGTIITFENFSATIEKIEINPFGDRIYYLDHVIKDVTDENQILANKKAEKMEEEAWIEAFKIDDAVCKAWMKGTLMWDSMPSLEEEKYNKEGNDPDDFGKSGHWKRFFKWLFSL